TATGTTASIRHRPIAIGLPLLGTVTATATVIGTPSASRPPPPALRPPPSAAAIRSSNFSPHAIPHP
ncbi:MAG: hypothetical protein ACKO9S_13765, partial [Bacteroidota bacterium]